MSALKDFIMLRCRLVELIMPIELVRARLESITAAALRAVIRA